MELLVPVLMISIYESGNHGLDRLITASTGLAGG